MLGLDDLLAGYGRFRRGSYPGRRETYRALALKGQSPNIMVIGCCDSRVDPAAIFDACPGELFVVRDAMAGGRLELHGAWFSIETGDLQLLDDRGANFQVVRLPGIQAP